jgi:hypothetical protein
LAIAKGLSDSLKYHQLTEIKVNLIPPESQQSKLKSKDDLPSHSYQVQAELELNLPAIERLKKRAGRFILATNDLEPTFRTLSVTLKILSKSSKRLPALNYRLICLPSRCTISPKNLIALILNY